MAHEIVVVVAVVAVAGNDAVDDKIIGVDWDSKVDMVSEPDIIHCYGKSPILVVAVVVAVVVAGFGAVGVVVAGFGVVLLLASSEEGVVAHNCHHQG